MLELVNSILCYVYQHPVAALVILLFVLGIVLSVAASGSSSGGGGYSSGSASAYTSQIKSSGSAARQRMDRASDSYRSNVRDTLRR